MLYQITEDLTLSASVLSKALPIQDAWIFCDTADNVINIMLPAISDYGRFWNAKFYVCDSGRNAGTNAINILSASGDKINGDIYSTINVNGGSGYIVITGANDWLFISSSSAGFQKSTALTIDDEEFVMMPTIEPDPDVFQVWRITGELNITQIGGSAGTVGDCYTATLTYAIRTIVSDPPGAIEMIAPVIIDNEIIGGGGSALWLDEVQMNATGFIIQLGELDKILYGEFVPSAIAKSLSY